MEKFTHFCLYERRRIERYLRQQKSLQFIADKLDRAKSSMSDEIKQNSVNGVYDAEKAHHKAYVKRKYSKIQSLKVVSDIGLRNFVEENIKDDQSPEAVSGRLKNIESKKKNGLPYASVKAVYKFVASVYGRQIESHLYHNAVKRNGGKKRGTPVTIDGRVTIEKRPRRVEQRLEFGHYEGDFIESGKDGKGSLLVVVERKTRYPFLRYLEERSNATVNAAVSELLAGLPIKSLTIDNDISFQKHEELSELLEAAIYFCHPQAPHEKGTVENRNKAIRRYIKKKSDLSKYGLEYFAMVEKKLRTRYMKCLDYRTPEEAFVAELRKYEKKQKKQQKTPFFSGVNWTKNNEIITIKQP